MTATGPLAELRARALDAAVLLSRDTLELLDEHANAQRRIADLEGAVELARRLVDSALEGHTIDTDRLQDVRRRLRRTLADEPEASPLELELQQEVADLRAELERVREDRDELHRRLAAARALSHQPGGAA